MLIQPPTSKLGYHVRCSCCQRNLVWLDTTHGTPPGPDICSEACYDDYHARPQRAPAWAVED